MRLAIINNNLVDNIIDADAAFHAAILKDNQYVIDVTGQPVGIGDSYDGVAFTPSAASSSARQILTRVEFIDRFTDVEQQAIFTAAQTDVAMQIFVEKWRAATGIDLGDARVIAGVQAMETAGLIATGRAAKILA